MIRTYGTARLRGSFWEIETEPHTAIYLKRLFRRSDRGRSGKVRLSHTPDVCRDLEWFAQRYPLIFEPLDALVTAADRHRSTEAAVAQILAPDYTPEAVAMAKDPRRYQAQAAELCFRRGRLLLADDVGLGKTVSALTLIARTEVRPAVVVCPPSLQRQWVEKLQEFTPQFLPHLVAKTAPYRLPEFFGQGPDVVVIPYSKLAGGWAGVLASYARTIVFDEIQELRRAGSQKYSAALELVDRASWLLGLSATPVYNYGEEIFSVFQVLHPGSLGAEDEFRREWCADADTAGGRKIKDPRAFGSWARENGLILRRTRAEVARELPPVERVIHAVESDPAAIAAIESDMDALARTLLAERETEKGEKFRAAEEFSLKLRQATGIAKAPYVAAFVRMLVESGEKVVLFGWHRGVYDIWREKLKDLRLDLYTGSETAAQKHAVAQKFRDGELDVLVISLRSGAGLDGLQDVAHVAVFGELDWSPGVHEQCIGRIHRDGQAVPVIVYYLVSDEGSDPTISRILGLKREQVEGILDPHHQLVALQAEDHRVRTLAADFLARKEVARAA